MEALNPLSMLVIIVAIAVMFLQNMSMLRGNYATLYAFLVPFKLVMAYINAYRIIFIPLAGFDWVRFSGGAVSILDTNPGFFEIFQYPDYNLFIRIVAMFYYILGSNPVYIHFIMVLFSLIMFRYVILTAYAMSEDYDVAQKCGLVCALWPILLIHSTAFLRECPINLFFVLSFYYFVRYIKSRQVGNFAGAFFWSMVATMLHSGMIVVWGSYCLLFSMLGRSGNIRISMPKIAVALLLIFGLMSTSFSESMTEKFSKFEDAETIEELVEGIGRDANSANTQYISALPSNPLKLAAVIPYLYAMFALSPLPYQVRGLSTGVAWLLDGLPQMILLWLMYKYLWKERHLGSPPIRSMKKVGLVILFFTYLIFSLGTTCGGTAMRHRAKITPMLLIFAVMYWEEKKRQKQGFAPRHLSD